VDLVLTSQSRFLRRYVRGTCLFSPDAKGTGGGAAQASNAGPGSLEHIWPWHSHCSDFSNYQHVWQVGVVLTAYSSHCSDDVMKGKRTPGTRQHPMSSVDAKSHHLY
jgi:hypothetical protein